MKYYYKILLTGLVLCSILFSAIVSYYGTYKEQSNTQVITKTSDGYSVRLMLNNFFSEIEDEDNEVELVKDRLKYGILEFTLDDLIHNTELVDEEIEGSYENYVTNENGATVGIDIEKVWWEDNDTHHSFKRHEIPWGTFFLIGGIVWLVLSSVIIIFKVKKRRESEREIEVYEMDDEDKDEEYVSEEDDLFNAYYNSQYDEYEEDDDNDDLEDFEEMTLDDAVKKAKEEKELDDLELEGGYRKLIFREKY